MAQEVQLTIPSPGESVSTVELGPWLVAEGQPVAKDALLVTLETDKITLDIRAPEAGAMAVIALKQGETAAVGAVLGTFTCAAAAEIPAAPPVPSATPASNGSVAEAPASVREPHVMPAAARVLAQEKLAASDVTPTGPGGRLLKEDAERAKQTKVSAPAAPVVPQSTPTPAPADPGRREDVVPMTPIRRRIAERLVQAQQTAAQLTTFNEVDLSTVMALRKEYQEAFTKRHGVKLGFMSIFLRAVIEGLKDVPLLNAEIRDDKIAYRHYYDIGIAVSSERGLAVPVVRDAERLSLAEIEKTIEDFARRARENKLRLDELTGGTFTISNGGVFGSLLSTPILNPPQSGVLGMHSIQERPVARDGQVVIRPMMYVALTYDHRIVDGREAVTFLRRVKETVEQPARILLEV